MLLRVDRGRGEGHGCQGQQAEVWVQKFRDGHIPVGAEFIPRDPAKQGHFLNVVKTWIFGILKEVSK